MFKRYGILLGFASVLFVGLLAGLLAGVGEGLFAAPARPSPINYKMPDGKDIIVRLQGDEHIRWAATDDGYTLLFNKDGYLEYAVLDNSGNLTLSGILAHNKLERSDNENNFLGKLPKYLRYSEVQINMMREVRGLKNKFSQDDEFSHSQKNQKISGLVHAPVILVGFQDKSFGKTKADFEMLINQPDYTLTADGKITGSVHDYFLASSRGQINFQADIYGPYILPDSIIHYDYYSDGNEINLGRHAVAAASADGLNFADYDLDENGIVDCVHIIFAGYGQESGATVGQSIWAHMGKFTNPLEYDGKKIENYSCSPELRSNGGDSITHIGVIAHELSHVFGLPDFYDSDYGYAGEAVDMGQWCIMAHGSWNDDGRTPALHSAYARNFLGWVTTTELGENDKGYITMPNPRDSAVIYRVNTTTENEYFLLENRQQQGWDSFIPGSGMLICHVDENHYGWRTNEVNSSPAHRGYYVKQAGCNRLASNCNSNRHTDVYPQPNNTSFTDESVPYAMSWGRTPTEKPVTGITHDTILRTISFYFIEEAPAGIENPATFSANYQPLKAWMQNGNLHISGLTAGQRWYVYNMLGVLVHQDIAGAVVETWNSISLPCGIYIIRSENRSVKLFVDK